MERQDPRLRNAASGPSRNAEIEILIEASEAAAKHTLDFGPLMEELAKLVRKIVNYRMYAVMLPTGNGTLSIAYSIGFDESLVKSLRVPLGKGLTGRAAQTLRPVRVDEVDRDPGYLRAVDSVRSEVAVPLVARGKLVAVLDLQSSDPHAFDPRVSDLLELIASRFSLAIDVAQLYEQQAQQHSTLRTLHRIAQEFSQILHLPELLEKIAELVRTLIPYDVLAIYLTQPNRGLLHHDFGLRHQERVQWRDLEIGSGLVGRAALLRAPVLVQDTRHDPHYIESMASVRSEIAVPLVLKNEVIGVLDLESERLASFSDGDRDTLMLLAPQIAAAIENARLYEEKAINEARLERDLAAARTLQRDMLPPGDKSGPGIELAARNEPASEVSGDFYDFYDRGDSIGLLNADVSGKGTAAALYAALASGLLRTAAGRGLAPGEALRLVNQALLDRKIETRFLAAVFAIWNSSSRTLTMAGAGLPFPFVRRDGKFARVPVAGIPLGLFRDSTYEEVALRLAPGDLAVTLSDGFGESVNERGETYGERRLLEVLQANADGSAAAIRDLLFEDVRRFCEGCPPPDDRTAVVLRVTA